MPPQGHTTSELVMATNGSPLMHRDVIAAVNERGDDDDDEGVVDDPAKIGQRRLITKKLLKGLVKDQHLYNTASLNDKLYLHYHGLDKIEGLEGWTGLKALWLEGNGFSQIEGLETLVNLRCIYLHSNCIKKIGGLESCPLPSVITHCERTRWTLSVGACCEGRHAAFDCTL